MSEVEKTATPTNTEDFLRALSTVFLAVEGVLPTTKQLGMLFGQWSLETNTGKAMFNFAVGNVKITQGQMDAGLDYFSQFTGEPGVMRPDGVIGEGTNHFRAYPTLEAGIKSWLELLKAPRYKAGWDALKNDDAEGFAEGVAHGGYVSEPSQESYIQGVLARNSVFMTKIAPTLGGFLTSSSRLPTLSPTTKGIVAFVAAFGGVSALGFAAWTLARFFLQRKQSS